MKIAYILPHLELYGGVRRALELCNRLLKKHHKVYFYTPTGEDCSWLDNKVPVRKLSDADRDEFDVVVFSLESQYEEPKKFKTKSVVYYILHYGPLYKCPEVCKKSYQEPYYQIANSSWTASKIEKEIGRRPPVVYGGINFDMFHPIKTEKIYDVLAFGDKRRRWKGREDVEKIAKENPSLNIAYMYDLNPSQDKIAETYCQAKIFLSASWFEGWSWMAIEAMACGVPVITTDDGGSADYAKNGYNCFVVPPRKPKKMAKAIKQLLGDKNKQKMFIKNGLKTARKFTWEKAVKNFEKHLKLSII